MSTPGLKRVLFARRRTSKNSVQPRQCGVRKYDVSFEEASAMQCETVSLVLLLLFVTSVLGITHEIRMRACVAGRCVFPRRVIEL